MYSRHINFTCFCEITLVFFGQLFEFFHVKSFSKIIVFFIFSSKALASCLYISYKIRFNKSKSVDRLNPII